MLHFNKSSDWAEVTCSLTALNTHGTECVPQKSVHDKFLTRCNCKLPQYPSRSPWAAKEMDLSALPGAHASQAPCAPRTALILQEVYLTNLCPDMLCNQAARAGQ